MGESTTTLRELKRPLAVVALVFMALLAAQAWTSYYPRSEIFGLVGMAGERANDGRNCSQMIWIGGPPRGLSDISCSGREQYARLPTDPPSFFRLSNRSEQVSMSFWTRRPRRASVTQYWNDSVPWFATADSIRRALRARGATPLQCIDRLRGSRGHPFVEWWALGTTSLLLQGQHQPSIEGREWMLAVSASPVRRDC